MKIAIIGGGISGLSTYLHLQNEFSKHPGLEESVNVTLFEIHDLRKRDDNDNSRNRGIPSIGGGYGLAANGMKSLRRLNPEIHQQIFRNSFPSPRMQMMSARGWTLGSISNVDDRGEFPENCCMVLREVVINAMHQFVPSTAITLRKAAAIIDGEHNATVGLDNGEEFTFDLVIGADGIWSKTRQAIIGDKDWIEYRYAQYSIRSWQRQKVDSYKGSVQRGWVRINRLPAQTNRE